MRSARDSRSFSLKLSPKSRIFAAAPFSALADKYYLFNSAIIVDVFNGPNARFALTLEGLKGSRVRRSEIC